MASNDRQAREERARLRTYQARQEVHVRKQRRRIRDNVIAVHRARRRARARRRRAAVLLQRRPGRPRAGAHGDADAHRDPARRREPGRRAVRRPRRGPHLDRHAHAQRHPARRRARRRRRPAGRLQHDQPRPDRASTTALTCHRLTDGGHLGAAVRRPRRRRHRRPRLQLRPRRERARPTASTRPARSPWRASSRTPYSQGSQFFIVYEDTTLPADDAGGYTVIGQVTSGLDELTAAITDAGTPTAAPTAHPTARRSPVAMPVTITASRSSSATAPPSSGAIGLMPSSPPRGAASDHDRVRP